VSFLAVDAGGRLSSLGALTTGPKPVHHSYRCEVSCIDWYGNSRPIFIGARVFALSGTELVEGAVGDGAIADIGRVNLSEPPPQRHIALR
jgi:hypothetical protein